MSSLDGLLKKIKEACESHGLLYRPEKYIGEDDGARIRVVYVKPDNKLQYFNQSMGMSRRSHEPDPVEAEAVAIIDDSPEDGFKLASFDITKDDGSKVLEHLRADIASVIHNTTVEKLHEVIPDERWAEAVKMWNEGTPSHQIADHMVGVTNYRTVTNKMTALRKQYGEDVVLTNKERKRRAESRW